MCVLWVKPRRDKEGERFSTFPSSGQSWWDSLSIAEIQAHRIKGEGE